MNKEWDLGGGGLGLWDRLNPFAPRTRFRRAIGV